MDTQTLQRNAAIGDLITYLVRATDVPETVRIAALRAVAGAPASAPSYRTAALLTIRSVVEDGLLAGAEAGSAGERAEAYERSLNSILETLDAEEARQ